MKKRIVQVFLIAAVAGSLFLNGRYQSFNNRTVIKAKSEVENDVDINEKSENIARTSPENIVKITDFITTVHPDCEKYIKEPNVKDNNAPTVTAGDTQNTQWNVSTLYAKDFCTIYADPGLTVPISTKNYDDEVNIVGLTSTTVASVQTDSDTGYIDINGLMNEKEQYTEKNIPFYPTYHGQKTYMDYRKITATNTLEYQLQNTVAYTADDGIRMINNRYCIAIGTGFGTRIGQYVDLILENGTRIPCVTGDTKADADTDEDNIFTVFSGCCSEFIVETEKLNNIAQSGDISNAHEEWKSPVASIVIYDKFVE